VAKDKKLTLKDIAGAVGVSTATASRALAGHTAISEDTRELVMQAAARVGYAVPNRAARPIKSDLSEQVCVVFPVALGHGDQLANPFELSLLGGIGAALRERRRDFSISWQTPYDDESLLQFVKTAPYRGFIFFGQSQFHNALNQLGGAHRPLVVWGVATEGQRYCSVGTDNFQGGFRATKHLIRNGRRRIAFMGPMPSIETARTGLSQLAQRLEGYKAALESEGLAFEPSLIQTPASARFEGADGIDNMLESGIAFDGVVAASDL
jgi:DNA-binding LacI/PurR family transcriptional regulator